MPSTEKCDITSIDIRAAYSVYPENLVLQTDANPNPPLKNLQDIRDTAAGNADPATQARYQEDYATMKEVFDGTDLKLNPDTGVLTVMSELPVSKIRELVTAFMDKDKASNKALKAAFDQFLAALPSGNDAKLTWAEISKRLTDVQSANKTSPNVDSAVQSFKDIINKASTTTETHSVETLGNEAEVFFREPDGDHNGDLTLEEDKYNIRKKLGPKGASRAIYGCEILKSKEELMKTRYRPLALNIEKYGVKRTWLKIFRFLEEYRRGILIAELFNANLELPLHGAALGVFTKTLPNIALFPFAGAYKVLGHFDAPLLWADAAAMGSAEKEYKEVGGKLAKLKQVVKDGLNKGETWAIKGDLDGALKALEKVDEDAGSLLENKLALSDIHGLLTDIYKKADEINNDALKLAFDQFRAAIAPRQGEITLNEIDELLTNIYANAKKTEQVTLKSAFDRFVDAVKLSTDKLTVDNVRKLLTKVYEESNKTKTDKAAFNKALTAFGKFLNGERPKFLGFGGGNTTHRSINDPLGWGVHNEYAFRTGVADLGNNFHAGDEHDTAEMQAAMTTLRKDAAGDSEAGFYNWSAVAASAVICDVAAPIIDHLYIAELFTWNNYELDKCDRAPLRSWSDEATIAGPGDFVSLGLGIWQGAFKIPAKWNEASKVFREAARIRREEKALRLINPSDEPLPTRPLRKVLGVWWEGVSTQPGLSGWSRLRLLYGNNWYGGKTMTEAAKLAEKASEAAAKKREALNLPPEKGFFGRLLEPVTSRISNFVKKRLPKLSDENEARLAAYLAKAKKATEGPGKGAKWLFKFLLAIGLLERLHNLMDHSKDRPFHESTDPTNINHDVDLAPQANPSLPDPQWHPNVNRPLPPAPPLPST